MGALTRQIQRTASFLRSCGLGRGDRVGIVLPNGPEMGTAFLSIASCSSAAPTEPRIPGG